MSNCNAKYDLIYEKHFTSCWVEKKTKNKKNKKQNKTTLVVESEACVALWAHVYEVGVAAASPTLTVDVHSTEGFKVDRRGDFMCTNALIYTLW